VDATTITTDSTAPAPFSGLKRRFYRVIAADPASHFKSYTAVQSQNPQSRRDSQRHYATTSFAELAALPVRDLASPDGAHLFLWTSGPFLPQAFKLIGAWGFEYSSIAFVWVKTYRGWDGHSPLYEFRTVGLRKSDFPIGLGLTTRSQCEIVLLARRGNCRRRCKKVRQLILAARRQHSRKPNRFYTSVEQYAQGPYADLFARERRPGWDCWGWEVDKFTTAPEREQNERKGQMELPL